jgi:hypothetical protein
MQVDPFSPLRRIAVFYDGTFFQRVSQYYRYNHTWASFIDLNGLHDYLRNRVAALEANHNMALAQVVEAHFFRGRFSLNAAKSAETLETDRLQDQLLMYAGVVGHYFPMNERVNPPEEKGIDVWLALEAFDLAVHKCFDVLALFAGDQDYVPLIRKVNALGTRVLVVGIDVEYTDQMGNHRYHKTSPRLLDEASYTVILNEDIDSKTSRGDPIIDALFKR